LDQIYAVLLAYQKDKADRSNVDESAESSDQAKAGARPHDQVAPSMEKIFIGEHTIFYIKIC
jgi:hypothetical protein